MAEKEYTVRVCVYKCKPYASHQLYVAEKVQLCLASRLETFMYILFESKMFEGPSKILDVLLWTE